MSTKLDGRTGGERGARSGAGAEALTGVLACGKNPALNCARQVSSDSSDRIAAPKHEPKAQIRPGTGAGSA